jgi:hypothetical protein
MMSNFCLSFRAKNGIVVIFIFAFQYFINTRSVEESLTRTSSAIINRISNAI